MTGVKGRLARGAVAGVTAGAAVAAAGFAETRAFVLREVSCAVLPPGQQPIRVLHLSDIHLLPTQRLKLRWLSRLAELQPDLVVNTGDNLSSADAIRPLLRAWGRLLDGPGVFVFGSNDYWAPSFKNPLRYLGLPAFAEAPERRALPWRDLRAAMSERGWVDLTHRRVSLQVAGRTLAFRGTDDAHLDQDEYDLVAGPADRSADLTIGVTHAPYLRVLDQMAADGLDLIFAGHTHGGQVCLPFKGALITNCDLDTDRVKGLSTHVAGSRPGGVRRPAVVGGGRGENSADSVGGGGQAGGESWLHVSAGLGTSPFAPYRTFCRPEATLLTLTSR